MSRSSEDPGEIHSLNSKGFFFEDLAGYCLHVLV